MDPDQSNARRKIWRRGKISALKKRLFKSTSDLDKVEQLEPIGEHRRRQSKDYPPSFTLSISEFLQLYEQHRPRLAEISEELQLSPVSAVTALSSGGHSSAAYGASASGADPGLISGFTRAGNAEEKLQSLRADFRTTLQQLRAGLQEVERTTEELRDTETDLRKKIQLQELTMRLWAVKHEAKHLRGRMTLSSLRTL